MHKTARMEIKLDYTKINCYDLEMCCWDDPGRLPGEIIAIGVAQLSLHTGEITKEAHYYVTPKVDEVSDFCTRLTGITPAQVRKQGRQLSAVLASVQKNFGGSKIAYAAWGNDYSALDSECKRKGVELPIKSPINASMLYSLMRRSKHGSTSLSSALAAQGLVFEGNAHNALVDAKNLARLIHAAKILG